MTKTVKKINNNLERVINYLSKINSSYSIGYTRNNIANIKAYRNLVIKRKYVYISVEHLTGHRYQSLNNLCISNCAYYENYTLKFEKSLLNK